MFAKVSTAVALFMLAAQVAAAPPACLIAAISTTQNPSDVKSICSSPSNIQSTLSSKCGSDASTAQNAFIAVCKDAGVTVSAPTTSSSTGSSTTSGQTSATQNGSGFTTSTTPSKTGTGSATGTSASPGTATGAASRLGMDVLGMAAIGVFGAMLAGSM